LHLGKMNSSRKDDESRKNRVQERPQEEPATLPEAGSGIEDILSELPRTDATEAASAGTEAPRQSVLERIAIEEHQEFDPWDRLETDEESPEGTEDRKAHRLYARATSAVLESIRQAERSSLPDLEAMGRLVEELADSIRESSALLLLATDRRQEFSVSTHCANTAVLALRIAQALGASRERQIRVGLAALLHEIGVVRLTRRVLHQSGEVGNEVRNRPLYSAEILRGLGPGFDWLVETVEQVYEREDGSGIPRRLKRKQIREEAKILGISDLLEACIHTRPYREALTGFELFHELTTGKTRSFSDPLVRAVLKSFSLYPYNEYVVLNTGEIGQVVEVNLKNLLRPRVKILYNNRGERLEEYREIDLEQTPSQNIVKAIPHNALPDTA